MPDRPLYVSHDEVNPKTRLGQKKPSITAVPATALLHCALAMMDGERKYGLYNWREKDVPARIYVDAMFRHMSAWADGEECAEDSGVHHLGHVMACCAIVLDAQAQGVLIDDRGIPGKFAEVLKEMSDKLAAKADEAQRIVPRRPSPIDDEPFNRIVVNNEVDA
jgi:hypothetical protein